MATPGAQSWWDTWDGGASLLDGFSDVAQAPDGDLYAAGVADFDYAAGGDFYLMKRSPAQWIRWEKVWAGPAGGSDAVTDLVVDPSSAAILIGTTPTTVRGVDWAIVKYNADGSLAWQTLYDGAQSGDWAEAGVCDAAGNVYVAGKVTVAPGDTEWRIVKFRASSGTVAWEHSFAGLGAPGFSDTPLDIAIDGDRNLYVAGLAWTPMHAYDMVLMKVTPSGGRAWKRSFDGPSHDYDVGWSVLAPPAGGVYVAATTYAGSTSDAVVSRYDRSGHLKWRRTYHDKLDGTMSVGGLAADRDGNVYLAATSSAPPKERGILAKWSQSGRRRWLRTYLPAGVSGSLFNDLVVTQAGNSFVCGSRTETGGSQDWLVLRFDTDGTRRWGSFMGSPANDDWLNAITLCGSRSLFVGGVLATGTTFDDFGVAKYVR